MKQREPKKRGREKKKLKTYDFAYLVMKNNESLRKEEVTKKKGKYKSTN